MSKVSRSHHLQNRNGNFYYRRRLSGIAAECYGKRELRFSLNTRDIKEARKKANIEDVRFDARLQAHISKSELSADDVGRKSNASKSLSVAELEKYLDIYFSAKLERAYRNVLSDPPATFQQRSDSVQDTEIEIQELQNLDAAYADERVYGARNDIMKFIGENFLLGHEAEKQFGERVRRKLVQFEQARLDMLDDGYVPVSRATAKFRRDDTVDIILFSEVADQFSERAIKEARIGERSEKWVDKLRSSTMLISELIGPETPITSVDHDTCLDVREILSELPKNRSKKYHSLTISAAIAKSKSDGHPTLSETTQKTYLQTFIKILDLATKMQYLAVNPASGMQPIRRRQSTKSSARLPFDEQQIMHFFMGEYYTDCAEKSPLRPYAVPQDKWRFWLPLICLFMGMRPGEVCQLETADIMVTHSGTVYINVSAVSSSGKVRKKLKTASSERRVPLHPELLKIGFLNYVSEQLHHKCILLFDELRPNRYDDYAVRPLRKFNETFLKNEMEILPKQSFYSWRHSFRDALRRCDAPNFALDALAGWSQRTVTSDDYGDKYDPDTNLKWMERVKFGDLDLSFLYCKDADLGPGVEAASNKTEKIGITQSEVKTEAKGIKANPA